MAHWRVDHQKKKTARSPDRQKNPQTPNLSKLCRIRLGNFFELCSHSAR